MANRFRIFLRLVPVLWAACVAGAWAVGGDEIPPLSLHFLAATDPSLGARYCDPDGFYSFQPPAQWKRDIASMRGEEIDPWRWRVLFRDKGKIASVEVGVVTGPSSLEKDSLSRYMGDFVGNLRRNEKVSVEESGLYLYDRYHCVLVRGRQKGISTTWFLLFGDEPRGEGLQWVTRYGERSPSKKDVQRMEAVFTSVRWPDLNHGNDRKKEAVP